MEIISSAQETSPSVSPRLIDHYETRYQEYDSLLMGARWLDFPRGVSIETFAYCNAACSFCPYPDLERKGEMLPTDLVERVIDELASIPDYTPERLVLCRVNEPMLDKRLFDFMRLARQRLPETTLPTFTNGTTLTEKNVDMLLDIGLLGSLIVSLNDHRKQQHESLMKISYDLVIANLDRLEHRAAAGEIPFPVVVTRVASGGEEDREYLDWCEARWPSLHPTVTPAFDWLGATVEAEKLPYVPVYGCSQWFDLNILADGREAFCCVDSVGINEDINIHNMTALEMYNRPERRALRKSYVSRQQVEYCRTCTFA
jgi:hypothetical protein